MIDIGANIGDSPIYFALNNAKNVIALEPYPYSYNSALKNIKKNNIDDKIILLNAGYGLDGTIKVNPDFENTIGTHLKSFNDGVDIKILSYLIQCFYCAKNSEFRYIYFITLTPQIYREYIPYYF